MTFAQVCREAAHDVSEADRHPEEGYSNTLAAHLDALADLLDEGTQSRAAAPNVWHLLGYRKTGEWIDQLTSPLPGSIR